MALTGVHPVDVLSRVLNRPPLRDWLGTMAKTPAWDESERLGVGGGHGAIAPRGSGMTPGSRSVAQRGTAAPKGGGYLALRVDHRGSRWHFCLNANSARHRRLTQV